jgi:quercetin dioxygenase-like cupin family protein
MIAAHHCASKGDGDMQTFDLNSFEPVQSAPGFRVCFPLHSATGTASTATVLFELDPGTELAVHTDSAEELLIIVQGMAEARVGDEVGRISTHEIALVPPMVPHGLRNVGDDVLRVLGTFSASTVVSTFEEPFEPGGPQVIVIGSPVPMAAPRLPPSRYEGRPRPRDPSTGSRGLETPWSSRNRGQSV